MPSPKLPTIKPPLSPMVPVPPKPVGPPKMPQPPKPPQPPSLPKLPQRSLTTNMRQRVHEFTEERWLERGLNLAC